ncbi:MAG: hypothetical protein LBH04_08810 [Tannerellaceae bacterium]|jgi:hypothetical protein|nr:hypothetical protein [Tannerellaceae bacterium]
MKKDYIPRRDVDLAEWGKAFVNNIAANAAAWAISQADVDDLLNKFQEFDACLRLASSASRTTVITLKKNQAREAFTAKIREMVGFQLRNPAIGDDDRKTLGLPVRDRTYTRRKRPTTFPILQIKLVIVRMLAITYHERGTIGKAKPYGVSGALIAFRALDAPPASPTELTQTTFATRSPHRIEFTEEERGKTVYFAACWQNVKGERGPWGPVVSAIVP